MHEDFGALQDADRWLNRIMMHFSYGLLAGGVGSFFVFIPLLVIPPSWSFYWGPIALTAALGASISFVLSMTTRRFSWKFMYGFCAPFCGSFMIWTDQPSVSTLWLPSVSLATACASIILGGVMGVKSAK
jgi:hypothetical protein